MQFLYLVFLLASLFLVIKSADFAIRYSSRLAEDFRLPRYIVGFIIVAVISMLPEAFISVTSALEGVPSLGLGTLFGSNVADLTLVLALVVFIAGRNLKVESSIIKNRYLYICMMGLPIIFGLNGYYSRIEGIALIICGLFFYSYILKNGCLKTYSDSKKISVNNMIMLILSMAALLLGAHLVVKFGVELANGFSISPVLIGMFVIGLGTTLPELFFAVKATKKNHDCLALGDILGTVIADATIVLGVVAAISPFAFQRQIIFITGVFMLISIVLLLYFMKSGRRLTKQEAFLLLLFYAIFVAAELLTHLQ